MHILITGVTGFIGGMLADRLADHHIVTGMSRGKYTGDSVSHYVKGSFDQFEDLRKLDQVPIDIVIHLAAVTGECSEEDGLTVNVLGTRRLYRYMLDRGCKRFITASSIAAVGCLNSRFVPLQFPIPDDHPCLATDAYGLSKAMVEQLSQYYHRMDPTTDFVNLRLGAVVDNEDRLSLEIGDAAPMTLPFVQLAKICVSDVVEAIRCIVHSPSKSRALNCNLVGLVNGSMSLYTLERMNTEFAFVPRTEMIVAGNNQLLARIISRCS